jgi:hypothetical protein
VVNKALERGNLIIGPNTSPVENDSRERSDKTIAVAFVFVVRDIREDSAKAPSLHKRRVTEHASAAEMANNKLPCGSF